MNRRANSSVLRWGIHASRRTDRVILSDAITTPQPSAAINEAFQCASSLDDVTQLGTFRLKRRDAIHLGKLAICTYGASGMLGIA